MREIILLKYGEMALKGLNKKSFEEVLLRNLKRRLKPMGQFKITHAQSTITVEPLDESIDLDEVMTKLGKVFGIASICRAMVAEKDFTEICEKSVEYFAELLPYTKTFKVNAKRADKNFPMKSPEICMKLGEVLLEKYPNLTVDLTKPEVTVTVEIRDRYAFVHAVKVSGAGGLPVGTSGNAMLLLSGGFDSPVAGYMMAKRGIHISAVHFVSPPYTSERARMKVEELCREITEYCGDITFYCVPFTDIQVAIKENCNEEYFTIIMRRLMMKIAQKLCREQNCMALVTGESVGQVASQTIHAIACTDEACHMPVFRPLIGMDKTEIIEIARKIDTFETSIQPYEDCCTVFTPKHPKIRPTVKEVIEAEQKFDFSEMIETAVNETEKIVFKVGDED